MICHHGFYHIVNLGEWERRKEGTSFRRRGKALRNMIFVVKSTKHGMQGRLLMFQEQPFEVQTNYAGARALRCNFDVKDLRRVLPEKLWKPAEESCPSLRVDENRSKEMGYMGAYEWDGEGFEAREGDSRMREPSHWGQDKAPEEWRQAFLAALEPEHAILHDHPFICSECGAPHHKQPGESGHLCECLECECERAGIAAFADSINTGFYVNSYTTKQCPSM